MPDSYMPIKRGPAPKKGGNKLVKRIAKTTGTTRGEAKGIMKQVRSSVRSGDVKGARKTLNTALKGGPSAGVPTSAARKTKARATSKKVVKRIRARQSAPTRSKRTVSGSPPVRY